MVDGLEIVESQLSQERNLLWFLTSSPVKIVAPLGNVDPGFSVRDKNKIVVNCYSVSNDI